MFVAQRIVAPFFNKAARSVVITGANRGLGRETGRQLAAQGWRVFACARDQAAANEVAHAIGCEPLVLDVTSDASIQAAVEHVRERVPTFDALVNNAGVARDGFNLEIARDALAVNVFGPMHVTDAFAPLLAPTANVVMVSSGLGQLSLWGPQRRGDFARDKLTRTHVMACMQAFLTAVEHGTAVEDGWPKSAYSVSKAGLNAFVRVLADEPFTTRMRVNAVCPGWVRTDMGGATAECSVEDGARSIVWAVTLAEAGPTGGFFRDGEPLPW